MNNMLICFTYAGVLELVDEADSKSVVRDGVWVRVPPPVPKYKKDDYKNNRFYYCNIIVI